ncbi:MAG: DUF1223 domain-containing protein [Pseudomonadota bacterium]
MRQFFKSLLFFAASAMMSLSAQAQSMVVVELYTSQGCSSCPPADDFLTEVASRDDVIALGLHVDYWDYLGWQDDLAQNAFTKRQAEFNTTMKSRYRLVTPQMIFNGRDYVAGPKRQKALKYINQLAGEPEKADLQLTRQGETVEIVIRPLKGAAPGDIHVVRYTPEVARDIRRGENAGRKITYTNTVTQWETVASWDGTSELRMTHPVSGDDHVAVILQTQNLGPIQAARKLD